VPIDVFKSLASFASLMHFKALTIRKFVIESKSTGNPRPKFIFDKN